MPEAVSAPGRAIPEDSFLRSPGYRDAIDYRRLAAYVRAAADTGTEVPADSLGRILSSNPYFYDTYNILGDYYAGREEYDEAVRMWKKALALPMPKAWLKDEIQEKIENYK